MRYILVNRHRVPVEEPIFWAMVRDTVGSTYQLAKGIHGTQQAALPDAGGNFWKWLIQERSVEIRELYSQLDEGELRKDLVSLERLLLQLDSIDDDMVRIVAKTFGRPMPQSRAEYRKLKLRFDAIVRQQRGQPWFEDVGFKPLMLQGDLVFHKISQIRDRVDQHVKAKLDSLDSASEEL